MSTSTSIILIAGKAHSGKTSLCAYLQNKYLSSQLGWVSELSFADPLKLACKAIFLLSHAQLHDETVKEDIDPRWMETPRLMFQYTGDILSEEIPKVLPFLHIDKGLIFTRNMHLRIKALLALENPPSLILISDGRLPGEHAFIKSLPNSHSIRLVRGDAIGDTGHTGDISFTTDITWSNNDSIDDLHAFADELIAQWGA